MAFKEAIARVAGIACCRRRRRCCGFGASAMAAVFVFLLSSSRTNRRPTLGKRDRPTTKKGAQMDDRARKRLGFFLEPIFPFSFFFGIVPAKKKKACPWRRCLGANLRMRHTHTYTTQKKRQHNGLCRALALFFFLALWFLGTSVTLFLLAGAYATSDNQRVGEKKFVDDIATNKKRTGRHGAGVLWVFGGFIQNYFLSSFFVPNARRRPQKSARRREKEKKKKETQWGDQQGQPTVGRFFSSDRRS